MTPNHRDVAWKLIDDLLDGQSHADELHDGWAADNGLIAARILLLDLFNRGEASSARDVIGRWQLPGHDVVAAVVASLATSGNGPFDSTDREAARILAPLSWSEDWGCYHYGGYAFALSGTTIGLFDPMDMPPPLSDTMMLDHFLQKVEQESGATTEPRMAVGMTTVHSNQHSSVLMRVPAWDGSGYRHMTEYGGRRPFAGQIGHARMKDVEAKAREIAARRLDRWERRAEIDTKVAPTRQRVIAEIGDRPHVRLLSVSLDNEGGHRGDVHLVRLSTVGNDLKEAVEEVELQTARGNGKPGIRPLRKLLVKLDARLANGKRGMMIDDVAAKALDSMDGCTSKLAHHVDKGRDATAFNPSWCQGNVPGLVTAFKVKDGCVTAKVRLDDGVYWNDGGVTIQKTTLPDSIVAVLPGRPLRDVIDHPWINGEARIASCKRSRNGSVTVRVTPGRPPLSEAGERSAKA